MNIRDRVRSGGLFSRLRRYPKQGWIAGVCVGLGEFFGWNVKLIRVLLIASFVVSGFFPVGVIYLALWYLMDEAELDDAGRSRPYTPSGGPSTPPSPHTASNTELSSRFARLEQRLRNMEDCVTSSEFELRRELRKLES
ncbi:PspC domain-containing protein [Sinimarinibacterium sp. CAU 1509]|uniref:PspC domain-containing protein n=1 Tax=Sinimarinibacterium sp. CAU 1509 TaxID=2562283 RepID=UPI0010ACC120|nr:PspC domain-containing protein [Sinimarinibacterium sp. CAU 1509]TJY60799.1 PspC domain-containing protein [Sinimarinibacterium sp. CAU 1509]